MARSWTLKRPELYPSALLWAYFILLLCFFQLQRLALLARFWRYFHSAAPAGALLRAFPQGLRLDEVMAGYLLLPCILAAMALTLWNPKPRALGRRLTVPMGGLFAVAAAAGWGELEFFSYFRDRYNAMAVDYADTPGIVGAMVWERYHPLLVLGAAALTTWAALVLLARARRRLEPEHDAPASRAKALGWLTASLCAAVLFARGGIGLIPVHLGAAYFSVYPAANKLAVNGLFSLVTDVEYQFDNDESSAKSYMYYPPEQALERAKAVLLGRFESWAPSPPGLLLKTQRPPGPSLLRVEQPDIVVVLEESFAAQAVGALGGPVASTPEFDRYAKDGVLFTRWFSQGERTGRALFSLVSGMPSPPGKQVTKTSASRRAFATLGEALVRQGYRCRFVYGGDLEFDNMDGFLREHGFSDIIGLKDFPNGRLWQWKTKWGVPDHLVLDRVHTLLQKPGPPTFTLVLTLSNHPPFKLPAQAPKPYKGELADERNAMHYADWSLGRFLDGARASAYFDRTLFVVLGDHAQYFNGVPSSDVTLFHVPCLFYGPKVLKAAPRRVDQAAGHTDLAPTLIGLLGRPAVHGFWGRDLFHDPKTPSRVLTAVGRAVFWIEDKKVLRDELYGRTDVFDYEDPDRLGPGRPLKASAYEPMLVKERSLTQTLRLLTSPR